MHEAQREQQIAQAESLLAEHLALPGFAKGLYFGEFRHELLPDYPELESDAAVNKRVDELRRFCLEEVDPVEIDRQARIPEEVISGLGRLGVLGACLPVTAGGLGWSQTAYCRLLQVLGGHCGSTALFVNAHHSIGPRAIALFGTEEQQRRWIPGVASGEWLSAFALTEPEAGSDAANVQTTATPTEDGLGWRLNGEKRWITNGGVARVLTVMARTPTPTGESEISAFLVTPDTPGFEVVEARMEKLGVRGTATGRLAFHDMFVPRENLLGPLGKGLRIALTVLDFGRTTFGASCTGTAWYCVERSLAHARRRVQFGRPLGRFELVQQKLAAMQAGAYAMEACTYETAALIDAGTADFMLETAMLKVFSTETLWRIIDDTFQLHGGLAYFTDQPFERILRDARINTIGEGANDVLRVFIALVGMREVGLELEGLLEAIFRPLGKLTRVGRYVGRKLGSLLVSPAVPVRSAELEDDAARLGRLVGALGGNVERLLRTYQREVVERQQHLARIADAATEIYVSCCVLRRLDSLLRREPPRETRRRELATGRYYLQLARRRIEQHLRALWDHDDEATSLLANDLLAW